MKNSCKLKKIIFLFIPERGVRSSPAHCVKNSENKNTKIDNLHGINCLQVHWFLLIKFKWDFELRTKTIKFGVPA